MALSPVTGRNDEQDIGPIQRIVNLVAPIIAVVDGSIIDEKSQRVSKRLFQLLYDLAHQGQIFLGVADEDFKRRFVLGFPSIGHDATPHSH